MQCTPDLLPSDITGVNVFNQRRPALRVPPGPVFANLVLVDEINRASPKTQSGAARVHAGEPGHRRRGEHELQRPFMVVATQNPIEYEGTYPLPEAQLDRFIMRLALGYPPRPRRRDARRADAGARRSRSSRRSCSGEEVRRGGPARRAGAVDDAVCRYVVALLGTPAPTRASRSARARARASRCCACAKARAL